MSSRLAWFVLGIVFTVVVATVGGYVFVRMGGVPMETTARPLPFEETIAKMALRARIGHAPPAADPLPVNETNLLAGVRTYKSHCAVCHSTPGEPHNAIAMGMFPDPPELFKPDETVTDDPESITFWKVTHGIRLSGMPGFGATLSDIERWQVTMLLSHAEKLPPQVSAALRP